MTETQAQPAQSGRNTQGIMRWATGLFVVALFVHGADHMRRGTNVVSMAIVVAGTVQLVLALLTALLVLTRSRWARWAVTIVGAASAVGFIMAHLLPSWFGAFSDTFINATAASRVNGFSWFAAIFEIAADIAVGVAGLAVLLARRQRAAGRL
jgi:hypothetical protein